MTLTYTDQEMLTEIRAAIFAAVNNKAYSIGGRSYTRQDLTQLRQLEDYYTSKVAAATGSLSPTVARFRTPE